MFILFVRDFFVSQVFYYKSVGHPESSNSSGAADIITPVCTIYGLACLTIITLSVKLSVAVLFQLIAKLCD